MQNRLFNITGVAGAAPQTTSNIRKRTYYPTPASAPVPAPAPAPSPAAVSQSGCHPLIMKQCGLETNTKLAQQQSPLQELEVGPRSVPTLLTQPEGLHTL